MTAVTEPGEIVDLLRSHPLPYPGGGKEQRGRLVVVGGSVACPGAVILAGTAALRAGAGKVKLVVHPSVAAEVAVAVPESLTIGWDGESPLGDDLRSAVRRADAVIVGPGLLEGAVDAARQVEEAMTGQPLLLDAGALPAADDLQASGRSQLLIAPNPEEATELLGGDSGADDPIGRLARALVERLGCPVAVRGADTVVDDGSSSWQERDGASGLGTAGSGDVLVGVAGGLLARGVAPLAALAWAVAIHARAGSRLAVHRPVGYLAREVADEVPLAMAALQAEAALR